MRVRGRGRGEAAAVLELPFQFEITPAERLDDVVGLATRQLDPTHDVQPTGARDRVVDELGGLVHEVDRRVALCVGDAADERDALDRVRVAAAAVGEGLSSRGPGCPGPLSQNRTCAGHIRLFGTAGFGVFASPRHRPVHDLVLSQRQRELGRGVDGSVFRAPQVGQ